ncbi:RsfA family transcriptional regulator [Bacillus massilinigeriensis]|uniref:RsfA family transcriptional regulator n=1 Tax=Bacillus mediterraneensis TaxID=1805474 RepID=UPI0008F90151|nr:RsfA family transcriptional regulator [Bacillus mediterraneensis]
MTLTRQDAWTQDEDLLLAETVLRHIRNGGTQLKAFEEVGKQLSRTAAACGFRWNSSVRKQFHSGIELAKRQRKEIKKPEKKTESARNVDISNQQPAVCKMENKRLSLEDVKNFLDGLFELAEKESLIETEKIKEYEMRIKELERQIYYLSAENEKLENKLDTVEKDHRAIMEIMERAIRMRAIHDSDRGRELTASNREK